ncbi:MAG: PIN domain-containing protein [Candidatus Kentron sp. G]|nr:MAG: PIN domain-containing protein [Candidatus Kentron sp. G]VFM99736.1 MAG: PIN domain-containing protein [Candidatus Kentron sp. G]VFN07224.1 MAG: PIN domain-containing protein [Candidatus Kentron sp. G]
MGSMPPPISSTRRKNRSRYRSLHAREVLAGFRKGIPDDVLALLDPLPHLPIARESANRAALLRQQYAWKSPDAFQAALALQHDCKLVTRNTNDFDPRRHGFVMVPYRI